MPIVFAPADPVSPSLSAAQGYATEFAKLFPSIASMYTAQANRQAGGQLATQQGINQTNQFNASQEQEANLTATRTQSQADMQTAQQTATSQQIDQKAQNEAWLSQQQLTQADVMQRNKAQTYLSWLQSSEAKNMLPAQQLQDEMTNAIQVVNGYDTRQQTAQARLDMQQKQKLMDQHAAGVAATNQAQNFAAKNVNDGVAKVTNPATGETQLFLPKTHPDGTLEWEPIDWNKLGKDAKDTSVQDALRQQVENNKQTNFDTTFWNKAYDSATKRVDSWAAAHVKQGSGETAQDVPLYPQFREPVAYRSQVQKEHARELGYETDVPPSLDQYLADRRAKRTGQSAAASSATSPSGNVATPNRTEAENQGRTPTPAQTVQSEVKKGEPVPATKPEPFNFSEPKTETHKAIVDDFNVMRGNLAQTNLWNTDRKAYDTANDQLYRIQKIWEQYGTEKAMPPQVQRDLGNRISTYNQVVIDAKNKINSGALPNPNKQIKPVEHVPGFMG
jgi:hypothetical protein